LIPAVLFSSIAVLAASKAVRAFSKSGPSTVVFNASGPGGVKIEGQTPDLEIRDQAESVWVIVPLKNLSTGISLRDKHMKEKYLETEKYPDAELRVRRADLKVPTPGGREETSAKALLKLHGREKPVVFNYRASESGGVYSVDGSLRLNIAEFGIITPTFMGVTVRPDVEVRASFRVEQARSTERTLGQSVLPVTQKSAD
jgi:polyisoprenoid-binding protein YceI